MQVLDKLDMNNITVQHVVLASIPAQDPPTSAMEVSVHDGSLTCIPPRLCRSGHVHGVHVMRSRTVSFLA